jgi:Rps23 Pro-64 3,4-dihydroxylase Tpa1-like proline 4-hydroxylase
LYFNDAWDPAWGGCLNILNSSDSADVHATILPIVGNSSLLVRSNRSWHSVSRVADQCTTSRRSVNVIFHLPGAVSTMWPPGKTPDLHDLEPVEPQM